MKQSNSNKTVTMKMAKPAFYLKCMRGAGVSEEIIDILKKSVKAEIQTVVEHMETDGWDLNFHHVKNECLEPLVSNWFEWYLISSLTAKGYLLQFKPNEITGENNFVITKEDKPCKTKKKAAKKKSTRKRKNTSTK